MDIDLDDRTGFPRAVYMHVREGLVHTTKEVEPGQAFADYDTEGLLIGIEMIAPCEVKVLDRITIKETSIVKAFIRNTTPHGFIRLVSKPLARRRASGREISKSDNIKPSRKNAVNR